MNSMNSKVLSGLLLICLSAAIVAAQAQDRAAPTSVDGATSFDYSSQMHIFSYKLSNPSVNPGPIETLVVKFDPRVDVVTGITSPEGWRAFVSPSRGTLMWAATGYKPPPADDLSTEVTPSDYAVAPGTTAAGFSFKSFGAPGSGVVISQSYAPVAVLPDGADPADFENSASISTLPEENGYQLTSTVPMPTSKWTGVQPASSNFLVFVNVADKAIFRQSALIVYRLAIGGETVNQTTLKVLLNKVDVTAKFQWNDQYRGYVARFLPGTGVLRSGSNTIQTSISGTVPSSTRVVTDTDRATFSFTP